MVRAIKNTGILIMVLMSASVSAQFSIGGGASTLLEFGNKKPFFGLHLNAEFPRNNEVTFYGRLTYHFKQNSQQPFGNLAAIAKDISTDPQWVEVPVEYLTSVNYFMIDGGTRYYLINGFDEGFSLYGGTNIGVIFNSVTYGYKVGDYDAEKYTLDAGEYGNGREKGSIIRMAIGFTGGAKYTIPTIGSFYLDFNPHLTIFGIPSTNNIPGNVYRPVFFNLNIGFRKEIY